MESVLLDVAGHRRSPATMSSYHRGRSPEKQRRAVPGRSADGRGDRRCDERTVGDRADGHRLRALIVLLWRAGLRISEALSLQESDADRTRGAVLVRRGKGRQAPRGRDGPLGMGPARSLARDPPRASARRGAVRDPRTDRRTALGSVGRTQTVASRGRGRRRETAVRTHQLRHAHAVEMAHEGVPLVVIERQLGHYAGDPVKRGEH